MTARRHVALLIALVGSVGALAGCSSATTRGDPGRMESPADAQSSPDARRIDDLFAGKFPGVDVIRLASGGITFRIRGTSTVMGSSEPLIVVDGTPLQNGGGGMLFLNPSDIQKVQVLKDVGSTAAYGVEGANGVILITTKHGR